MDNEKSAIEEFLGDIGETKEDPFKSDDPFQEEIVPEDKEVVQEEDSGKRLSFAKDPKVQKYVQKEIAKALKDLSKSEVKTFTEAVGDEDVVGAFTAIIGNDTPEKVAALRALDRSLKTVDERAAKKALEQIQHQRDEQVAKDQAAVEELEASFEEIEDTYNVTLTGNLRTAFVDYIRKVAPKDRATGEVIAFPDIPAAWEEFQEKNKRSATRAKTLASQGMTRSTDTSLAPKTGGKSWKDVDKFLSNLSN